MIIALVVILILAAALVVTYLILSAPNSKNKRAGVENLRVHYAHRGLWGDDIPENSIPAFARAAECKYGIELDVQLSSDGDVVVFHDYNLSRMCGEDTKVSELRGAELSWRRLGGTKHTLPLLEDVLAVIKGRVPVLIELKGETSDTALCEAVAHIIQYYDGKVCVQSFNPYLLGWFKKHQPRLARGMLYTDFMKHGTSDKKKNILLTYMVANFISRPDFISADMTCLDTFPVKLMTGLHKLPVFVWTVRDADTFARMRSARYCCIFEGFKPEL
ncbi:MAG: glycerophosphodiester phosphodiesterase [Clostridia bacterium]|nr:glycerophosphodiester phosphodiesterase [Clostridia bacterium]